MVIAASPVCDLQSLREGPEQGRQVTRCQYMRLDVPLDIGGTLHLPVSVVPTLLSHWVAKHIAGCYRSMLSQHHLIRSMILHSAALGFQLCCNFFHRGIAYAIGYLCTIRFTPSVARPHEV